MTNLVKLSEVLAVEAQIERCESPAYIDAISQERAELINEHTSILLFFGRHATDAEDYTAVEAAFDQFDPSHTLILFEGAGYCRNKDMANFEKWSNASVRERMQAQRDAVLQSRNAEGAHYWDAINSFHYARAFCAANGYSVFSADMNEYEMRAWDRMQRSGDQLQAPVSNQAVTQVMNADFLELLFVEAMQEIDQQDKLGNVIVGSAANQEAKLAWGALQQAREMATVNQLTQMAQNLAADRLTSLQAEKDVPKRQIALFFGAAHKRGIETRLREKGITYTSTMMMDEVTPDAALDMPFDEQVLRARMHQFVLFHGMQDFFGPSQEYAEQRLVIDKMLHRLTLGDLQEVYERFRVRMKSLIAISADLPPVDRAIVTSRISAEAPASMRSITNDLFTRAGISDDAWEEVRAQRLEVKKRYRAQS